MNDFTKSLQFSLDGDKRLLPTSFDEKIALSVYTAILDTPTLNKQEINRQLHFLKNINTIIHNYDDVMLVLESNLANKFNGRPVKYNERS